MATGWLPQVWAGGIIGTMPSRRSADTAPDMFSVPPSPKAPGPSAVVQAAGAEDDPASQPRHVLPKDLASALKRLDNGEIDALLSAVITEAAHRGRLPTRQLEAKAAAQRTAVEEVASGLTKGRLNAVHAAFKAGVKPSASARQFGISQSDVRKALARGPDRGS